MTRVVLEHVTKRYGDYLALDDVSLEIRDGDFFVLLGPSGSGKSTLLRLIAGLENATSGKIYIGDRLVNNVPAWDRGIAMAFEAPSYGLYPNMTAYNNMAFGIGLRDKRLQKAKREAASELPKVDSADYNSLIRRRIEQVAVRLGLSSYLNRKQEHLSAGQRQSVALGRAVTRRPTVFLLDDPLSQIDAAMRVKSRVELALLHRQLAATTVYVTHDQTEAMALGSRVAVLANGVLQQLASPQNLYDRPANVFVATFIGSPPMNLFRLQVRQEPDGITLISRENGAAPDIVVALPPHHADRIASYADREVSLGVRPESFVDADLITPGPEQTVIQARIEHTEYNGHDIYFHLVAGGHTFVARLDKRTPARPGYIIRVAFDNNDIRAFDPTSGQTLI